MVQSVSTSGNIAAALMAAAQEREEMRRRMEAEQAAANARLRPEQPKGEGAEGLEDMVYDEGNNAPLGRPLTQEEKDFRKYLEGFKAGRESSPPAGDEKPKRGPSQNLEIASMVQEALKGNLNDERKQSRLVTRRLQRATRSEKPGVGAGISFRRGYLVAVVTT